jgi:hypothetical protein
VKATTLAKEFSTEFTTGKKEKRSKKERNGGYYYLPLSSPQPVAGYYKGAPSLW